MENEDKQRIEVQGLSLRALQDLEVENLRQRQQSKLREPTGTKKTRRDRNQRRQMLPSAQKTGSGN